MRSILEQIEDDIFDKSENVINIYNKHKLLDIVYITYKLSFYRRFLLPSEQRVKQKERS